MWLVGLELAFSGWDNIQAYKPLGQTELVGQEWNIINYKDKFKY